MIDAIQRELDECEGERGVFAPFAVESGSRSWGFQSEDSDYDVRFVYVRHTSDYLRLEPVRDTIEWRLDEELDIVGWDVTKFLRLLRGSNPTAFEWLGSEVVYRDDPMFKAVRDVAPLCFSPVTHAHHYLGMATRNSEGFLRVGRATLKRYLYVVRALLACRWAIVERRPVPMAFEELKQAMLEPDLVSLVDELAETKRSGMEAGRCDAIPELDEWILRQETELQERIRSLKSPQKVAWQVLDDVFVGLLGECERRWGRQ